MKVSELFESKVLIEGTWAVPETIAKAKILVKILSKPIPLKTASTNLYSLIGDDGMYDDLDDALASAKKDKTDSSTIDVRHIVIKHLKKLLKGTWKNADPEAIKLLKMAVED